MANAEGGLVASNNLADFVRINDIRKISGKKNYYVFYDLVTLEYRVMTKTGMEDQSVVVASKQPGDHKANYRLSLLLESEKRQHHDVYLSLKDRPGNDLNLFKQDKWLKPIEYDGAHKPHPIFDILLTSLAGGNRPMTSKITGITTTYKDFLEKCLLRKVFFPGDRQIPSLIMYGCGGVGKELFFLLCKNIFGNNAMSTEPSKVFGHCNSHLQGRVVVFFDDYNLDEDESNKLKTWSLKNTITLKAEHSVPFDTDNITWWFASYNTKETDPVLRPPVFLEGDGEHKVDRRWLVIKHKHALSHWVEDSEDYKFYKESGRFNSAYEYMSDRIEILNDQIAISHWLGWLIEKHGMPVLTEELRGGYGPDYDAAIAEQNKTGNKSEPHEKLAKLVFESNWFNQFEVAALFKFYQDVLLATRFKRLADFGQAISRYKNEHDRDGVWGHFGSHPRAYWERTTKDEFSSTRKNINLLVDNTISVDLKRYYDDYYLESSLEEIEGDPVEWAEAGPDHEESSARRKRWFDDVRFNKIAERKLALNYQIDINKGFNNSDYMVVVMLLDEGDFANFIGVMDEKYKFALESEGVDVKKLIKWQHRLCVGSADIKEERRRLYADIWDVSHLLNWFGSRQIQERINFLSALFTKLSDFKRDEDDETSELDDASGGDGTNQQTSKKK